MHYTARFFGLVGMLLDDPPGDPIVFELPHGATYGDLLDAVGERFGHQFPPNVWDPVTRSFHPQVVALIEDRSATPADRDRTLTDGGVAAFFVPIAGG
ncbi:MAG: hypothetical protein ABFC80_00020 [Coriobacteriales bacterium]|nr:MoaD/ThiS family protein [Actinomycetes bacterium]